MIDSYDFSVSILICHECGEASEAWEQNVVPIGNDGSTMEVKLECPSCHRYIGHNERVDISNYNYDLASEIENLVGRINNVNTDEELIDIQDSLYDVADKLR